MFISVLTVDLNTNPWLAVQSDDSLQALINNNTFDGGANQNFPRSPNDHFIQTKQIREINTPGSTVTAHVIQLVTVQNEMLNETIVLTTPKKKKKKKTPTKKAIPKKAGTTKKKIPTKKAIPKKAETTKKKTAAKKKPAKKINKKPGNKKR